MIPSLAEVRELVATMVERSNRAWIGEGCEVAEELLAYIDGRSPNALAEWKEGMDDWAYIIKPGDPGQTRGPFDSYQKANDFLASMPEYVVASSPMGPTCDRADYVVITREQFKAQGG